MHWPDCHHLCLLAYGSFLVPGSCSACPQPEAPGLNATLEQFSVTGSNGSLWIMTPVPHPLGDIMLMLKLYTDSQSCPLVLSSSPTVVTCLMAQHGLRRFPLLYRCIQGLTFQINCFQSSLLRVCFWRNQTNTKQLSVFFDWVPD